MKLLLIIFALACIIALPKENRNTPPGKVTFNLQKRIQNPHDSTFTVVTEKEDWDPAHTAIIVCDMWDQHWCRGAQSRVAELAPHMNQVLNAARDRGILIVHSPSDCMKYYAGTPQRLAAQRYAQTSDKYQEGRALLPTEKNAVWPIDQSNGGCNDTPRCVERYPWTRQTELIEIKNNDVISDSGNEIIRLFKAKGIDRVILLGVHTNMCVISRPFGLRSMIGYGEKVVLMRDMTDVMYDARQAPYVNHFEGLGRVVEYIEKYVAPSIVSTDLTGEPEFTFREDPRH